MLGRCSWVKKYIGHELCSIVMRGTTYSRQNHPQGWGREGEVSNSTGYRSADSWRAGEDGNIPLGSSWGKARAVGGAGAGGRGGRGRRSEDLGEFHPSPHFCNEVTKVNKVLLLGSNFLLPFPYLITTFL
jgi:hypothetical protein